MTIDQLIEAYTYARVTGSSKPLDHLDTKAEEYLKDYNIEEVEVIFANDEYEAKLRYVRNEATRHKD